jgi:hypothetical protein
MKYKAWGFIVLLKEFIPHPRPLSNKLERGEDNSSTKTFMIVPPEVSN